MKKTCLLLSFFSLFVLTACQDVNPMDKYLQNLLKHNVEKASSVIEFQSEGDGEPGEVPSVSCDSKGGEFTVHFKTSQIWEAVVVAPTKADDFSWVTLSRSRGEAGEVSLVITLKENTSYDSRRAVVRIKSGEALCEIDIFQDQVDVILVEENEFNVPAEGGNPVIVLKTNIDFEVDIPAESARWISVEPYTKALNTKYVELIVAGNDGAERSGKVYVVNKKSGISAVVTINQEAGWIDVTDVSLYKTELTITVGDPGVKLVATVTPDNATDKTVNWSSDNEAVATVDNQGNVYAVAPGTANITVTTTDGNKTATCAVTVKAALPEGALPGVFSVSADKKVYFSQGNLQATYNGSGYTFGFAANQYDYIGDAAGNTTIDSQTYGAVVDLFCWSTDAVSNNWGIHTKEGTNVEGFTTGNFKDWGKVFDDKGTWRTLTKEEWNYLFNTRNASKVSGTENARYSKATVKGIEGIILLPETYVHPSGVADLENINKAGVAFTGNIYDLSAWTKMESAGAVFLPAAGYRQGSGIPDWAPGSGRYWTTSNYNSVSFTEYAIQTYQESTKSYGYSVRLVTEVPAE